MYQLRLYGENLLLITPLEGLKKLYFQNRINSAGHGKFLIPYTHEHINAIKVNSNIAIYEGDIQKFSGYIENPDLTGTEYSFEIKGHATKFRQMKTPKQWGGWNNKDLADVVRDHLNYFRFKRLSTQIDWQGVHELYQVDVTTEPGTILIEYEPHPEDPENLRPKSNGYIIIRNDLGIDALSTGRLIRWTEIVGEKERITIQSRSADTDILLDSTPWSIEESVLHVDDIAENETKGIALAGDGRWIDIKINLYADDQETPLKDREGNIASYGFTPGLQGIKIIWREPSIIQPGNIPELTGILVDGFNLDRVNHLKSIVDICNQYNWEFKVRQEGQQLLLDLQEQFGEDRSLKADHDPIIFQHGANATITTLRDNTDQLINVLHCWGSGEGAAQLYHCLTNDESIRQYGERTDDFDCPEAETLIELMEAGQKELDKKSIADVAFKIEAYTSTYTDDGCKSFGAGDTITVVNPKNDTLLHCRIFEEAGNLENNSEKLILGLNNFIINPFERLMPKVDSEYNLKQPPQTPSQVTADGKYGHIVVKWHGNGDSYAVKFREKGTSKWLYKDSKETQFVHLQLSVGSKWEYSIAAIKNNNISSWSDVVSAKVLAIPPEDLDKIAPKKPTNLQVDKDYAITHDGVVLYRNKLSWDKITLNADDSPISDLKQYIIERADKVNDAPDTFRELGKSPKATESFVDLFGLEKGKTYYYRIYATDTVNNESEYSDFVEVTIDQEIPVPGGEITVTLLSKVNSIRVEIAHTNRPSDIAGYEVYADTTENFVPSADNKKFEGYSLVHEFPANAGIDMWIKVRAYNRSGMPGEFVQVGPIQSRLVARDDIDTSIFINKIEYESNGASVFSPDRLYDIKQKNTYVTLFKSDSIIFEYSTSQLFDACLSKIENGILEIFWSNDKTNWNIFSNNQTTNINGITRHTFDTVHCRFLKFKVSLLSSTAHIYVLKPFVSVYADYGLFGEIDAGLVTLRSGEKDGERIVQSGLGVEQYARGSDNVIRKVFERLLNGSQHWYNKETGNLMHQFLAETGDWEIVGGKIVIKDDQGNRSVLDKNHLSFYENGSDIPYYYTKRVKHGTCKNGDYVELNWPTRPKVITSPQALLTYRPGYDDKEQLFETRVEFDGKNNFNVYAHTSVAGVTDVHDVNESYYANEEWESQLGEGTYDTSTKISITIEAYVDAIFGGYAQGIIYYKKESDSDWTKWGYYAPAHGTTHTYVKSGLDPAKYMVKIVKGDYGRWKILRWNEWADIIISDLNAKINYIAIEGGIDEDE